MNNILQMIKNMSPSKVASIAAIIIFLISFFVYVAVQMSDKDYAVLYSDLELSDARQIVNKLDSSGVDYHLDKNGTEILVPASEVNRLRIETVDFALGSGISSVGYEVFDNTDALGSTNFVQNVNLLRALEGELARTISSVENIKTARVHLVMPKREIFSREEQKPSASVIIKTKNGPLNPQSIQAIQKLIASAVPKLDMKDISIVDSNGNLLTEFSEEQNEVIKKSSNETMRLEQEYKLNQRLQDLLEKSLGKGKAQVQVNLEMDFDEVVTNEEIFDPDSQVIRSQASMTEEGTTGQDASQPVTVGQNIPNSDSSFPSSNGSFGTMSKTEETINYEISRIVRNKVKNTGTISRVTAAVSVDGTYKRNDDGFLVYQPRTPEEMERITNLVKSAVGYDADRGDLVEVVNIKFSSFADEENMRPEKLYMGFTKQELMRMAEGLGVAIVAILVILLVIRPLVNNAFEVSNNNTAEKLISSSGDEDNLLLSNFLNDNYEDTSDELINMSKVDGRIKVSLLKKLNATVENNPDAAVNIIRGWLYGGEG
ncbi:MAG: flagellar M-ring protein FliF [Alphaproteobacteria bacterium]|nr:flagellar M-ring protein FliF [Alphaproteobacteria bacterium]